MTKYSRLAKDLETDASGRVSACFASADIALDGHRILAGAFVKNWKGRGEDGLSYYRRIGCPLVKAHDLSENSAGRVEGLRETEDGRLTGIAVFSPSQEGRELAQLYCGNWQSSFSISWDPCEWSHATGKDRSPGAIDFKRVRLLEISAVSVPSDANAVVQRARSGDLEGAAKALGVKLAISEVEPHVAEIAIREAARLLRADHTYVRSINDRATFFAFAKKTFNSLRHA